MADAMKCRVERVKFWELCVLDSSIECCFGEEVQSVDWFLRTLLKTIWAVFVWFIIPFVVSRGAAGCKTAWLDARSSSLGYLGFLVGWIVSSGCDGFGSLSTLRGRNKDSFNFFVDFLGPSLLVYSVWLLSMNVLACLTSWLQLCEFFLMVVGWIRV